MPNLSRANAAGPPVETDRWGPTSQVRMVPGDRAPTGTGALAYFGDIARSGSVRQGSPREPLQSSLLLDMSRDAGCLLVVEKQDTLCPRPGNWRISLFTFTTAATP